MTLDGSARYVLDASVAATHQAGRCTLVVPEFALLEILNAVR